MTPHINVPYKPLPVADKPEVPEKPVKAEPEKPEEPEAPAAAEASGKADTPEKQPVQEASAPATEDQPVFKVQILANGAKLKKGSPLLKGQTDADFYKEGGMYKYTVGASTDYQEIYRLRKSLLNRFPQAFIIAFKNGTKMDVNEAIREYKSKKVKR